MQWSIAYVHEWLCCFIFLSRWRVHPDLYLIIYCSGSQTFIWSCPLLEVKTLYVPSTSTFFAFVSTGNERKSSYKRGQVEFSSKQHYCKNGMRYFFQACFPFISVVVVVVCQTVSFHTENTQGSPDTLRVSIPKWDCIGRHFNLS